MKKQRFRIRLLAYLALTSTAIGGIGCLDNPAKTTTNTQIQLEQEISPEDCLMKMVEYLRSETRNHANLPLTHYILTEIEGIDSKKIMSKRGPIALTYTNKYGHGNDVGAALMNYDLVGESAEMTIKRFKYSKGGTKGVGLVTDTDTYDVQFTFNNNAHHIQSVHFTNSSNEYVKLRFDHATVKSLNELFLAIQSNADPLKLSKEFTETLPSLSTN